MKVLILNSLALVISIITSVNLLTAQEMEANNPLPEKYISNETKVWLNDKVNYETLDILISAPVVGPAVIMYGAAYSQQEVKQMEIANSVAMQNDSALLAQSVYTKFSEELISNNVDLAISKDSADYVLNINVYDHGFHWATSSAAGVYVRVQAELISKNGELLWTQLYHLTKKEAKVPYNRKAMTFNKCIDRLLVDYENNPDLMPETYNQINGFLAAKLFSTH